MSDEDVCFRSRHFLLQHSDGDYKASCIECGKPIFEHFCENNGRCIKKTNSCPCKCKRQEKEFMYGDICGCGHTAGWHSNEASESSDSYTNESKRRNIWTIYPAMCIILILILKKIGHS